MNEPSKVARKRVARSLNAVVRAAELEMYEGIAEIRKLTTELESLQHRMARAADALRMTQSPNGRRELPPPTNQKGQDGN